MHIAPDHDDAQVHPLLADHPVTVELDGPIRADVQQLPAQSGGFRSYAVAAGTAVRILDQDPRRKRALVIAHDTTNTCTGVVLGTTQAEGASSISAVLPLQGNTTSAVSPVLELTLQDEIWASTVAGTATVTVINEQWCR